MKTLVAFFVMYIAATVVAVLLVIYGHYVSATLLMIFGTPGFKEGKEQ